MDAPEAYGEVLDYLMTTDAELRRRKKHRLPLHCYSASDCEFFFTLCARHCGEPFANRRLAADIVDCLLWRRKRHGWELFCYCLMPDHLHFIVKLPPGGVRMINGGIRGLVPEGILEQVRYFKRFTTTQIWWKQGGERALWQKSSYDRVIRYNDSIDAAASYVLNNPVRKGLVARWEDYPFAAIVDPW